jgi:sporulation protein YlmC with PRC-barrel domain
MTPQLKGFLALAALALVTVSAPRAFTQSEDDLSTTVSPSTPAQALPERAGPESAVPAQSAVPPSSELVAPTDSNPVPLQQTLLSSKTVVGVTVNNAQGEKLGTIRELMIDPHTGQVMYAVVDSSGSFGLGKQKSFAVPWKGLRVKLDQTEVVVQLEQDQFPMQSSSVALNRP